MRFTAAKLPAVPFLITLTLTTYLFTLCPDGVFRGQWGVEWGGVLSWGAAREWVSAVCAFGEGVLFDSLWECGIPDESHGGGVWGAGGVGGLFVD